MDQGRTSGLQRATTTTRVAPHIWKKAMGIYDWDEILIGRVRFVYRLVRKTGKGITLRYQCLQGKRGTMAQGVRVPTLDLGVSLTRTRKFVLYRLVTATEAYGVLPTLLYHTT